MKSLIKFIKEQYEISWKKQRRINAITRNLEKRGINPLSALGDPEMSSDPTVRALSRAAETKVKRSIHLANKGIGSYQKVNREIEERDPLNTSRRTRRLLQKYDSRVNRGPIVPRDPVIIDLKPEQQN